MLDKVKTANNQRRYEQRNKSKQDARILVRKLVKSGKLIKENCFLCDEPETQAHHLDYTFQDKVIWLCQKHHSEAHYG